MKRIIWIFVFTSLFCEESQEELRAEVENQLAEKNELFFEIELQKEQVIDSFLV